MKKYRRLFGSNKLQFIAEKRREYSELIDKSQTRVIKKKMEKALASMIKEYATFFVSEMSEKECWKNESKRWNQSEENKK